MKIKYQNVKTGEVIREYDLHAKQERFIETNSRFVLYSGGFGAGKTMPMIYKIIKHLEYPNNRGILGRKKLKDLRNSAEKDFFDMCPQNFIQRYDRQGGEVEFINGSSLILAHFDSLSVESIKSMNLGFAAIDQVEEIDEEVFDALDARLRRKVDALPDQPKYHHQIMMTSNPVMHWTYKRFKQLPPIYDDEGILQYELLESSTLDNAKNLPRQYIESLLRKPESWKRQFVYGVWDESLLAGNAYFPIEYIQEQSAFARKAIREFEGIRIYREVEFDDEYQVGVDPSEGVVDFSPIVVVSKKRAEVVAVWHGKVPPDALAHKAAQVGRIYRNAKIVPEMNSVGYATVQKLRDIGYASIYRREVLDNVTKKTVEKYGWRTTYATKMLLLDNFLNLMRDNKSRLNDPEIISEMKTFVWSDEAKKQGLGAADGFHDDLIMATALAFWNVKGNDQDIYISPQDVPRGSVLGTLEEMNSRKIKYIGH